MSRALGTEVEFQVAKAVVADFATAFAALLTVSTPSAAYASSRVAEVLAVATAGCDVFGSSRYCLRWCRSALARNRAGVLNA